jgi:hypothetical protein
LFIVYTHAAIRFAYAYANDYTSGTSSSRSRFLQPILQIGFFFARSDEERARSLSAR